SRLCIADTVGHATPTGAQAVVRFARRIVEEAGGGAGIGIDWHGHRDRDMGTINSIAALDAGASRVHGTILGIGERVGNTPMDLLMVNLVLMGWSERDLTHLNDLVQAVSDATGEPIPDNYPVFAGVPARLVGRSQQIEIGPMSGRSNVVYWLEHRGFIADEELIDRVFRRAKGSSTVLTEQEILREIAKWKSEKVAEVEK